jgi:hypothetical protein
MLKDQKLPNKAKSKNSTLCQSMINAKTVWLRFRKQTHFRAWDASPLRLLAAPSCRVEASAKAEVLTKAVRPCVKNGRNCETNPISFKTYYPSMTNNENISFLPKSKSYNVEDQAYGLPRRDRMLPIVAVPLPQMLPFKLLQLNHVTDVTAFSTSYTERSPGRLPAQATNP